MAINVFQKKERQELITRLLIFLVISIFLMSIIPPSFDFSYPEKTVEEKENYSRVIDFLDSFDFNQFGSFNLIPNFKGPFGKSNPFLEEGLDFSEEVVENDVFEENLDSNTDGKE